MGFRQAAVLATCCFFLGVLFICFFVDYRILHQELTEEVIEDGFQFYTTFFNAPPAIKAVLHGFMGAGILALVSKLVVWDESAMFFDGSSLAAYIFCISVYIAVIIPSLRTIVTPVEVDTRDDRIEAMRILSAGNTIIMVIIGAILALQGGQEYARRTELKELAKFEEEERKKGTGAGGVPRSKAEKPKKE
ncbi:Shr3 amino acid permease chaperone [Hygrophoropsis aurantiaca]|uniref:Shr3 amino acid permease chaperone n=1 Tax=Hygrophoropsis aurantiaca TaxID=72124 RepID=A0ACB8AJH1_9AGAM|nr:Shr3 amino acid permease chaperone [Hygrophoropsis aurantiaca]